MKDRQQLPVPATPVISPSKYFGEQGPEHQGKLHWPGYNGLPFRGEKVPLLNQNEMAQGRLELRQDFHVEEFDLAKDDERAKYCQICDRHINAWYQIYRREPIVGKESVVRLEWAQRYVEALPEGARPRFGSSIPKVG